MNYYNRKRRNDDDDREEKRYPANPAQRRALQELDERGVDWWPSGDCYETNNSTILPDGREYKDM